MTTTQTSSTTEEQSNLRTANRVISNTHLLFAMTLFVGAVAAGVSIVFNFPHPGLLITLFVYIGLLFAITSFQNRTVGLVFAFALMGFVGYSLGPVMNSYFGFPYATQTVITVMGASAALFFALSVYTSLARHDFSYLGAFLFIGLIVELSVAVAAILFEIPASLLAVSSIAILLMTAFVLYETNKRVNEAEANAITITREYFVALFNVFTSLLRVFRFKGRRENPLYTHANTRNQSL